MQYDYMIYPKQFRSAKVPVEKNYCFFLMPFHEKFDIVYGSVKEQLMNIGFVCNRADELSASKPIINKILMEILRAQFIIVDLTDCNPNVFYELGIAHTFKDSPNVLLIKQRDSKVPFDITHLQYQEYTLSNLRHLGSIIKTFIHSNQYISDFKDALYAHGIIEVVYDNQDAFLDYIKQNICDDITNITAILNYQCDELENSIIENTLDRYQLFVHKIINSNFKELLPGALLLYQKMLIACSSLTITETHISIFLNCFFSQHELSISEILSYQTDMAVAFAKNKKQLSIVMPWIINYFSKSKATVIDLNRYKLEAFLMTTDFKEVNEAIINAIFSQDCHIREHLADIIGEKRLISAKGALYKQLAAEENFYTAVSIIEAIGKIGDEEGLRIIESWLDLHHNEIIKTKMFSVLRHVQNAIIRLDFTPNREHWKKFSQRFKKYLVDNVPL